MLHMIDICLAMHLKEMKKAALREEPCYLLHFNIYIYTLYFKIIIQSVKAGPRRFWFWVSYYKTYVMHANEKHCWKKKSSYYLKHVARWKIE